MSSVLPPPTYDVLSDSKNKAQTSWLLFFNNLFIGDTGTVFTPSFTNLGGSTTSVTGVHFRLSQRLRYFRIVVTPSGSTTSTAGSTYCTFPLDILVDGAVQAVGGALGVGVGIAQASTNRIYTPDWSAVTVPVTITGTIEAR